MLFTPKITANLHCRRRVIGVQNNCGVQDIWALFRSSQDVRSRLQQRVSSTCPRRRQQSLKDSVFVFGAQRHFWRNQVDCPISDLNGATAALESIHSLFDVKAFYQSPPTSWSCTIWSPAWIWSSTKNCNREIGSFTLANLKTTPNKRYRWVHFCRSSLVVR